MLWERKRVLYLRPLNDEIVEKEQFIIISLKV